MKSGMKQGGIDYVINQLVERVNDDTRRLRILEQRNSVLTSRMNSLEQSAVNHYKDLKTSMNEMTAQLSSLGERLARTEETLRELTHVISRAAPAAKVKDLENAISVFNPLKSSFVTREEVELMIKRLKTPETKEY